MVTVSLSHHQEQIDPSYSAVKKELMTMIAITLKKLAIIVDQSLAAVHFLKQEDKGLADAETQGGEQDTQGVIFVVVREVERVAAMSIMVKAIWASMMR